MCSSPDAGIFKTEVKQWLKNHGLTYLWMSERCGVSENTVRNWMAQATIPSRKRKLIQKLISETPMREHIEPQTGVKVEAEMHVSLKIPLDIYVRLTRLAASSGLTLEELFDHSIVELANEADNIQRGGRRLSKTKKMISSEEA